MGGVEEPERHRTWIRSWACRLKSLSFFSSSLMDPRGSLSPSYVKNQIQTATVAHVKLLSSIPNFLVVHPFHAIPVTHHVATGAT